MPRNRETGQMRGFAFVEMTNDDEAKKAIGALNGKDVRGRNVNVSEARPREHSGPADRGAGRIGERGRGRRDKSEGFPQPREPRW